MIIQKWDGRIVSVLKDSNLLIAIITDITNSNNPEEIIEIELKYFFDEDQSLISEGSLFYWHIIEDSFGDLYNEIKLYRKTKKEIAQSIKTRRKIKKKSKKLFNQLNKEFLNE